MANKTSSINWKHIVNFFAYVAIVMIGVALILAGIIAEVASALTIVANAIAYVIVSISALYYARSKRNIWFLIVWIVAIVLIIVSYFI